MKTKQKNTSKIALALVLLLAASSFVYFVAAAPQGPTINYISNSTANNNAGSNRSTDNGGVIYTTNMNMLQQNANWKAYVGNITGSLTLDDASGYTIYNWAFTTIRGEVYATRASSVAWSSIACSSSTTIASEQSMMGMATSDIDSINNTYNYTSHPSINVTTVPITNATCRSTYTFINDAAQATSETNNFTAVLLHDNTNLVYTTIIADNVDGYETGADTHDFQLLIPQNKSTTTPTQYYFYVELG